MVTGEIASSRRIIEELGSVLFRTSTESLPAWPLISDMVELTVVFSAFSVVAFSVSLIVVVDDVLDEVEFRESIVVEFRDEFVIEDELVVVVFDVAFWDWRIVDSDREEDW